jgi:CBS domain-containing protein
MMAVDQIMSSPVASLSGDMGVQEAARMMTESKISSVVITKGSGALCPLSDLGIVTEQDIIAKVVSRGLPLDTKLWRIMSRPIICCTPQTTLSEAKALMQERHIRRIVVCENDTAVGVVSQRDLLRNLKYMNFRRLVHEG